jgi:cytoskeletal protein CcmA (bactofilin family)
MSFADRLETGSKLPFVRGEYRLSDARIGELRSTLIGAPVQLRGVGMSGEGNQLIGGLNRLASNQLASLTAAVGEDPIVAFMNEGSMIIDKRLIIDGSLVVVGDVDISGSIIHTGDFDISGNLEVGGDASFNLDVFIGGNLTVIGTVIKKDELEVSGNIDCSGNITAEDNITTLLGDVFIGSLSISNALSGLDTSVNDLDMRIGILDASVNLLDTRVGVLDASVNLLETQVLDLSNNKYDKTGGLISGNITVEDNIIIQNGDLFIESGSMVIGDLSLNSEGVVNKRIYQELNSDPSWNAVNGYYGLAKDAYPALDPYSSGVKAVSEWTIRNSAADNDWRGIAWAPELGLFAAVAFTGTGNRVMTSPDGINWTIRNSAADNDWRGIAWAPELGLFAAVAVTGTGDRVMTSPDGINWTIRNSAADNSWFSITWAPELGLFAAVAFTGTGDRVMTSSLQGRPPTSYNVFDSSFNNIDSSGNWTIAAKDLIYSSDIKMTTTNSAAGVVDLSGGFLLTATAGSNSGQFLRVRINGTVYKINLRDDT